MKSYTNYIQFESKHILFDNVSIFINTTNKFPVFLFFDNDKITIDNIEKSKFNNIYKYVHGNIIYVSKFTKHIWTNFQKSYKKSFKKISNNDFKNKFNITDIYEDSIEMRKFSNYDNEYQFLIDFFENIFSKEIKKKKFNL